MSYAVVYHEEALKEDIPKLSISFKQRIKLAIEEKLITHPELFGQPLRRSLRGYRKLRVGDYRVIFRIEKTTVKIFMIEHRSRVYREIVRRI